MRIVLSGYGLPGEYGLAMLFGRGVLPRDILVLTHPVDARNSGFAQALELRGVPYMVQPARRQEVIDRVSEFAPDVLLSLHYRHRIPSEILEACPLGGMNLHPALLPNYRGANSVAWAIINGEAETGFTYHRMNSEFDSGAILFQKPIEISSRDTAFSLFHRQITTALPVLDEVFESLIANTAGEEQVGDGSYYDRSLPHEGKIDPRWDPEYIERFIRAMYFPPFRPAILEIEGDSLDVPTWEDYRRIMASRGDAR